MAEQVFRSPGFFEQEIDLSQPRRAPAGVAAGIVGTALQGPAFVPVTVGSFADFQTKFGGLDSNYFGPFAVREWLRNRNAATFMRVLGAGANDTAAQIATTQELGTVTNAGFRIDSTAIGNRFYEGPVQFICAKHYVSASGPSPDYGFPVFSDNRSFLERAGSGQDNIVNLVRSVLFTASGTRFQISDGDSVLSASSVSRYDSASTSLLLDDFAKLDVTNDATFKLIISSSSGTSFASDDGIAGARIMTASLNPEHVSYIGKILNRDPRKFQSEEHLLYLDLPVEHELAPVAGQLLGAIGLCSGSAVQGAAGSDGGAFRNLFGRFDTRYTTPTTPAIISQPFGNREYDLMRFETISDGAYTNDSYKISIANIRKSSDLRNPYGTFEVQVRRFKDNDINTQIIERYPGCTLNPNSDDYVARLIGDKKVYFDFDADTDSERRLVIQGKYPNRSPTVRIIMDRAVERGDVPGEALPFGFRGIPVIKTSDSLTDVDTVALKNLEGVPVGNAVTSSVAYTGGAYAFAGGNRMVASSSVEFHGNSGDETLGVGKFLTAVTSSIVPPLPFRFKATRGQVDAGVDGAAAPSVLGQKGSKERVDNRFYWGVKTTKIPPTGSVTFSVLNTNVSNVHNPLIDAYTKMQGIAKLDALVTGSAVDLFNDNKFTLARVALYNKLNSSNQISDITGTANQHMIEACYIRNGVPDSAHATIADPIGSYGNRITMATLVNSSSVHFNRFVDFNKFTTIFYGGFDGLNILDKDNFYMNDKASSVATDGKAATDYTSTGLANGNVAGTGILNNIVFAYRQAARLMTDEMTVNTNLLAIPGIKDPLVTDVAAAGAKSNSMIMYVMDIPAYSDGKARLFADSTAQVDIRETSEQFDSRVVDNNYAATYFPDVIIEDDINNTNVAVPSSIAALVAIGFNDKVGYPWFAPAGFNRGALDKVRNTTSRLTAGDRDELYDARINPIATFPTNSGATFVIFGQKTLQLAKSALDRVNVRRMLLEVKRQVVQVANRILFEPNNAATRARFIGQISPLLALVQAQAGIESFQVVCDDSNNTPEDVESNRLNGRIVVVPTRAVEFIAIDFIITNSGVSFE